MASAPEASRTYNGLAALAQEEFSNVADYVWKAPGLIERETRVELEKLDNYFPLLTKGKNAKLFAKLRKIRWAYESHKLSEVFPNVRAAGNLFCSVSLYETYCLRLCKEIEKKSGDAISNTKGSGISKIFSYLSSHGVKPSHGVLFQQADAAIALRNCLLHASGLLEWSREQKKIRHIVKYATYLPSGIKANYRRLKVEFDEVSIADSSMGERLRIKNEYSFISVSLLREHFCEMYRLAEDAGLIAGQSSEA